MKNVGKEWIFIAQFHFQDPDPNTDPDPDWQFESGSTRIWIRNTAIPASFESPLFTDEMRGGGNKKIYCILKWGAINRCIARYRTPYLPRDSLPLTAGTVRYLKKGEHFLDVGFCQSINRYTVAYNSREHVPNCLWF